MEFKLITYDNCSSDCKRNNCSPEYSCDPVETETCKPVKYCYPDNSDSSSDN